VDKVNAQFYRYIDDDSNYYQMRKEFLKGYFGTDQNATLQGSPSSGQDKTAIEGNEFSQLLRWQNWWSPRLYRHGSHKIAREATQNYFRTAPSGEKLASQNANWKELGPNLNTIGGLVGVGQITSLAFDPIDPANIMYAGAPRGGVWKTINGGQSWSNLNTDQALARLGVSTIAVDPIPNNNNFHNIYVGTGEVASPNSFSDGVYRSNDGGQTWHAINAGLFNAQSGFYYIPKLLIDPSNANVMFAATSIGIFRTANRQALAPTWTKVYPTPASASEWMRNILFEPGNATTLYASGVNVVRSTNGGINWSSLATPSSGLDLTGTPSSISQFPGQYMGDINIAISTDSAYLYASILTRGSPPPFAWNTSATPYFYQYNITTQMWAQKTAVETFRMPIAAHPASSQHLLVANVGLHRTINGGASWADINCGHVDYHAIVFAPYDPNVIFVGTDGGVWKITFSGNTVSSCVQLNNGLGVAAFYHTSSAVSDPYQILAGSQDMATSYLKNNAWDVQSEMWGDGFESVIDYSNNNYMYATQMPNGGNGVLYRADTSINPVFNVINSLPQCNLQCNVPPTSICGYPASVNSCNPICEPSRWGAPLAMDPVNPNVLYQGRIQLWKTANARTAGNSCNDWKKISNFQADFGTSPWQAVTAMAVAPSDPNYVYVAIGPDDGILAMDPSDYRAHVRLYKTSVGGGPGMWTEITPDAISTPTLPGWITSIAVSHTNPGHIWISFSGYVQGQKVYQSSNGGIAWTNYSALLPNLPVNTIVIEKGANPNLYVGTDVGVYYNNVAVPKWYPFMDGLPNVVVDWLEINHPANKIRAATSGRGLWESDLAGAKKGMTWRYGSSNAQTGTITVGCNGCDAYQGDTVCTQQLPLLCIYKPTPPFPKPGGVITTQYTEWSGGVVATTAPVAGNSFMHRTDADSYCAAPAQFGPGWRVAEFHDGWGWNFQAYGGTVVTPRFRVHINDQPAANCWATP
jgi:hypothetical protein